MWTIEASDDFSTWYESLNDDQKAVVIAKFELLRNSGPALARPHADTLKGSKHSNMKELRAKTSTSVLRVAFAFDPDRRAILLVGGDKRGVVEKRFYKSLIDRADKIFDEHLANLKRR